MIFTWIKLIKGVVNKNRIDIHKVKIGTMSFK